MFVGSAIQILLLLLLFKRLKMKSLNLKYRELRYNF